MATKKVEGRMEQIKEKMDEVQSELQREIGYARGELQGLGPLERGLGVLLEKMSILDKVDRTLQCTEEPERPNPDRGKEATHDT